MVAARGRDHHAGASDAGSQHPLVTWVLARAGLDPEAYRNDVTARRVPACLRKVHAASPEEARERIIRHPALLPVAVHALLIGVTAFFRDAGVFAELRSTILPRLLARRRGIRVYAAGVSTGEELYSVAILLDELGALENSELLGVDCRLKAIAQAGAGIYDDGDVAGLTASDRAKYFPARGSLHVAADRLRRNLRWRCADLLRFNDVAPSQLILCRNVSLYLRRDADEALWSRLCGQLDQDGILVTGRSERPPASLGLVRIAPCLFQRT